MTRYVGIDLGTTNSVAAVFDGEQPELVRNASGAHLTPSVVHIDRKGRELVGTRARRKLERSPEDTRAGFKRLMGTQATLSFAGAAVERTPIELSASVLRSICADIEAQTGIAPTQAVISVPALFELPQSQATVAAARAAGLTRVELIQEPIASALAAGWRADEDASGRWMVYDLGGGTFDASLLETREGLLRVVGHDGDNFLGGRDFDKAIVDWALEQLAADGAPVDRSDPANAAPLRQLAWVAEEARIELTRAEEVQLELLDGLTADDEPVEVDLTLTRATLEQLILPLVDRSLAVCQRLLSQKGLTPDQLTQVVLVGGPTVTPLLRERIREVFGAGCIAGEDPMTLVARGAALFAATAGIEAAPQLEETPAATRRLWLQYPSMSADLFPFVAGKLLDGDGPAPSEVRFVRSDGEWASPWQALSTEGGLVVGLELQPRQVSTFTVEGRDDEGAVALVPSAIRITQGLTVSDPPLSRSLGVALAGDTVHTYLEKGTPLPARRTYVHHTVQTLPAGVTDAILRIPIVQGELRQAHLCRLVGLLEIGGEALTSSLAAGAEIEVSIEVDRSGTLSARALVPALQRVFEQVVTLVVPDAPVEQLTAQLATLRTRLHALRSRAERQGDAELSDRLFDVEWLLGDASTQLESAQSGDEDAAQKVRRLLIEVDGVLEGEEELSAWPELNAEAALKVASASRWVSAYGTPQEQTLLKEAIASAEQARGAKRAAELQRQLRLVDELGVAAYFRDPSAWRNSLERASSRVHEARDLARAQRLVAQGREALRDNDRDRIRDIARQLWELMPTAPDGAGGGYDSGLR